MPDELDPHQHLINRLSDLGRGPVDPELAGRVLHRATRVRGSWWRSTKLKVAAGISFGFLAGSVGLASANALPSPAQGAAHDVLSTVGINVPPGHDRYNGPECGGTYANHGAYVRAHKGDPTAAQSKCGKPNGATDQAPGGPSTGASTGTSTTDTNGHHGPPPWAHGHGKGSGAAPGTEDSGTGAGATKGTEANDGSGDGADSGPGNVTPTTAATGISSPTSSPSSTVAPTTTTSAPPTSSTTTTSPTTTTSTP